MIGIYRPNSKNTGCACSFYLGKDGNVYINAIQQSSWDNNKKIGSFSENAKNPEKSISIKLSIFECGGLIRAIESYEEYNMFHSYKEDKTQISFKTWVKDDEKKTKAFGLSIVRNSTDKFRIPVEYSDAIVIRQFLIFCLNKNFIENEKKKNSNT
jgi:hypothetical protein